MEQIIERDQEKDEEFNCRICSNDIEDTGSGYVYGTCNSCYKDLKSNIEHIDSEYVKSHITLEKLSEYIVENFDDIEKSQINLTMANIINDIIDEEFNPKSNKCGEFRESYLSSATPDEEFIDLMLYQITVNENELSEYIIDEYTINENED